MADAPVSAPVGPYSPVRKAGDWVVSSGQLGLAARPDGSSALVEGGVSAELRQALANLADVLATEGADLGSVVKATLFVVDLGEFGALNDIWMEVFVEPRPARTTIAVAGLPLGARCEVEAWAYVGVD